MDLLLYQAHYPLHLPAMPQFRKIARIYGLETLDSDSHWQHFDSSIGLYGDWRNSGKVYETPYGTLIPQDVYGVLAAGRCISATHEACAAIRVTPIVMAIGQAAGTAAAQSVHTGQKANRLDTDLLRRTLKAQGVFLEAYVKESFL